MTENTSESSIIPLLMCCQLAPASDVFQARCQVPAYTVFGSFGSTAIDSMFLTSTELAADKCSHVLPPSLVRYTPSSAPATSTLELPRNIAIARIDFPCMAGSVCHTWPPSTVRKTSPTCWLEVLHAET